MSALAAACGQPEVATAPPAATLDPDVPVTVAGGELRGAAADGNPDIVAFRGVPYAAPPVGGLRWKPPRPVVAWDGVRDASAPGPICMQTGPAWVRAPDAGEDDPESEDCLFLDIWAPRESREPRPVMVWIHGGGFFNGAGSLPIYDGARIAEHGVVLVSINYRLNVFGFFADPALFAESPHGALGNYGCSEASRRAAGPGLPAKLCMALRGAERGPWTLSGRERRGAMGAPQADAGGAGRSPV